MYKNSKKFLLVLFTTTHLLFSQPKDSTITAEMYQVYEIDINKNYLYKKPHLFDFITKLPRDFIGPIKDCGKKENIIALSCATITTVALLPYDQQALYESRKIGERIGLDENVTYDKVANITVVTPSNITSSLFLCGSKVTPIVLGIGFATYGLFKNDYRSLHTASGLVESTIITGIFSQTFKRISGRQEPHVAMETGNPGGKWSPFPGLDEYEDDPTNYSSFSSGHIMTATAALYVITGNYPEYKWIKPLGIAIIIALGFQMAQSNIHWYSDYPLSLVMGYIIGKNIAKSKFVSQNSKNGKTGKYSFKFNAKKIDGINTIGTTLTF